MFASERIRQASDGVLADVAVAVAVIGMQPRVDKASSHLGQLSSDIHLHVIAVRLG